MFNVQILKSRTPKTVKTWADGIRAAGGGFGPNSLVMASRFVQILQTKSYYTRIKYLLPMLGSGINAARMPLIDVLGVGIATNTSFVDADFSESAGLQGNGSSKYLTSLIKPSQLGSGNNGGLGYWENNISFGANVEPIGCYNTAANNRFVLDLRSNVRNFRWGTAGNGGGDSGSAGNGHYYGQRSSSTSRELFFNAAQVGSTNTTSDATSGAGDTNIAVVGALEPTAAPWPGRCAVAYFTDGTFTTGEITDFHNTLRLYLMIPSGKPQS